MLNKLPFVYAKRVFKCRLRLMKRIFKITNCVYKSSLNRKINLDLIDLLTFGGKLYNTQPQMFTISNNGACKLIFFKSGKFRLMGNGFHPTRQCAHVQLTKFYPLLPPQLVRLLRICKLECQTVTVTFSLQ